MKRFLIAAVASALVMGACDMRPVSGVEVYYIDGSGKAGPLQAVVLQIEESDIAGIASAMSAPPPGSHLVSAVEDVYCEGFALDGADLTLSLSAAYAELNGLDRTLADACIVMTFTALPWVDRVRVEVDGGMETGYMDADYFLLDDTITPVVAEYDIQYISELTSELVSERRQFIIRDGVSLERCLFDEMLKAAAGSGMIPVVPPKTRLISSSLSGGTLTLVLSQDFADGEPSDPRLAAMYIRGLAESFFAIEGIERIKLQAPELRFYGGVAVPEYLTPDNLP
ncbi:MAG: GerMN domain-containing protein [Oscillospiraceae bacterium]|nr:GerMN domain-containing protein [Oscillospiraceae bacterium]